MPAITGRKLSDVFTNKSGGSVAKGDVVVVDTANDRAIVTTTTGRAEITIGVVIEENGIANNATGRVLLAGYAPLVNVPASVTRGHYVETHTVAKQATGNSTRRTGSFGQFLTGGTTPTAWLWGQTDATASSGTPPDCKEALMSADVAIVTANTLTDLTGMSMSLGVGDWLIEATATCDDSNSSFTTVGLSIHDGSASVATALVSKDTGAGNRTQPSVRKRITLAGTATVKIQGVSTRGSSSTTFRRDAAAIFGVGSSNTQSVMHATKVTAA